MEHPTLMSEVEMSGVTRGVDKGVIDVANRQAEISYRRGYEAGCKAGRVEVLLWVSTLSGLSEEEREKAKVWITN